MDRLKTFRRGLGASGDRVAVAVRISGGADIPRSAIRAVMLPVTGRAILQLIAGPLGCAVRGFWVKRRATSRLLAPRRNKERKSKSVLHTFDRRLPSWRHSDWLEPKRRATSVCVRPSCSRHRRSPAASASLASINRRSSSDSRRKSPASRPPTRPVPVVDAYLFAWRASFFLADSRWNSAKRAGRPQLPLSGFAPSVS